MKKNKKVSHKKFIETYENKIKKYRQEYYNNILKEKNILSKSLYLIFFFTPFLISIITLIIGNFNITSHIIALFLIILSHIIIKIVINMFSLEDTNSYIREIRKLGYLSLEDYEDKVKKYILGPNGYYNDLKNELMTKYNISNETRKIQFLNGDIYFIWSSQNLNKIYLLNTKNNVKPEVKEIRTSGIRYFRCDYQNNFIVLKTEQEDYYLKMNALDILNEMIKEKKYENIVGYDAEVFINDFELYMHKIKYDIKETIDQNDKSISSSLTYSISSIIILIFLITLKSFLKKYIIFFNLIEILIIFILNYNLHILIFTKKINYKDDSLYIDKINQLPRCKNSFEEMKIALGIKNSYDKIYTKDKICYLTWIANGYFHLFLNVIYFNVVYISVKVKDVIYYRLKDDECIIKLKDKTLYFDKSAINTFNKILPNKDYEWLKGFKK